MLELLISTAIIAGAGVLWFAGLRLFLQSGLSRGKKIRWTLFLLLIGVGIAALLPLNQVFSKFLLMILILPFLGFMDVMLIRSGRSMSFWIRACGFEACTVFGMAAVARFLLDVAGIAALLSIGK